MPTKSYADFGAPEFTREEWGLISAAIADSVRRLEKRGFYSIAAHTVELSSRIEDALEPEDTNNG